MEKKEANKDFTDWDTIDEERKHLYVLGRDVSEIPCFRNSFLYGISGGFGTGLGTFMFTSRTKLSMHVAYGTFIATTVSYWFYCRYNYSKTKFLYSQLKTAMKQQALYEGTSIEEEVSKKAQSV
ncbi:hypothetical protein ACKWTF_001622 [Chironomus riparius]